MSRITSILMIAAVALQYATIVAPVAVFELHFLSTVDTQNGLGWPHTLLVTEGHDALLKLVKPLVNQVSCFITTSRGVTFDVTIPPNSRFESWGDSNCGVRIRNITMEDEGRWRMTAVRGDYNITGFSEVHVEDGNLHYEATPIYLEDGQVNANVNLTMESNRYCVVYQPFAASSLIPGDCVVTLDKTTRAVQGVWGVDLGIRGRVPEYHVTRQIAVEAERLDVGYIHDLQTHKLHLFCNILNSNRSISFCRFQKTSGAIGFNVVDGISDGEHSYYGEGFSQKHCGLTIENPTNEDFSSWRCSVGVQEWEGTQLVQRSPMQALITVRGQATISATRRASMISRTGNDVRTIFAQRKQELTISCKADSWLSYCWFQSPSGEQYTPVATGWTEGEQDFWYSGDSLMLGDCSITFADALDEFDGPWTCHMGTASQTGVEETDMVEVRITGPLAANQKEIPVVLGESATLHCHSSGGNKPLKYCRFVTPGYLGLNLDASVTLESAILDRYYFTPNHSLDYGDCSLTIKTMREEDIGTWTCAALVNDEPLEARDTIEILLSAERLDVGYIHDLQTHKLHLFCNILNSNRSISFCRFQKTSGAIGFNVVDGISDGEHSYYGEGFSQKHCGLTIENPTNEDFSSWRCSVGVQEWEGTQLVQRSPMQALITVRGQATISATRRASMISRTGNDVRTIFAQRNQELTISCKADSWLSYCWFQSPSGEQYTPVATGWTEGEQDFWYSGDSLMLGDCSITFADALDEFDGPFRNRELTKIAAILDRYYFTPNHSLDYGDCSLTIKTMREKDIGTWTCAALVNDEPLEARDTIEILLSASGHNRARAGVVGMAVSITVLVVVLAGILWHKYGRSIHLPRLPWQRSESPSEMPMRSMQRSSAGSSGSSCYSTSVPSEGQPRNSGASDSRPNVPF